MSTQKRFGHGLILSYAVLWSLLTFTVPRETRAQFVGIQNNIGGIVVDPNGVLQRHPIHLNPALHRDLIATLRLAPDELQEDVELRKISLRRLQDAIAVSLSDESQSLPQEIQFLAGLHRIQYILVYPDKNDIVLAGPGGGWTVDDTGRVVGSTGKPVLLLDDLIVALRAIFTPEKEMISCSINPTQGGLQQFQQVLSQQKQFHPSVLPAIEQALGPQNITVTGVPSSSHFAHVLVAADYRMKRIGMGLDPSPLRKLSSYMELIKSARSVKNAIPRWWLACNYEAMARSDDGLAWEIRGSGVKCMTENAFFQSDGTIRKGIAADPAGTQWAQRMTATYDELAHKEPVFAKLRHSMDFCVLAALIREKKLHVQAQCDLSLLINDDSRLSTYVGPAPRTVPSQASVVKRGRDYIISASGGIEIDALSVIDNSEISDAIHSVHDSGNDGTNKTSWWWN